MNDRVMKSYRFREEREADWQALDRIVTRAEKRGVKRLSDEDMLALPRLYRQAVSSLSMARSISLDQNLLAYLETLCARAYFFVYGTRSRMSERIAQFFARDWAAAVSAATTGQRGDAPTAPRAGAGVSTSVGAVGCRDG